MRSIHNFTTSWCSLVQSSLPPARIMWVGLQPCLLSSYPAPSQILPQWVGHQGELGMFSSLVKCLCQCDVTTSILAVGTPSPFSTMLVLVGLLLAWITCSFLMRFHLTRPSLPASSPSLATCRIHFFFAACTASLTTLWPLQNYKT